MIGVSSHQLLALAWFSAGFLWVWSSLTARQLIEVAVKA